MDTVPDISLHHASSVITQVIFIIIIIIKTKSFHIYGMQLSVLCYATAALSVSAGKLI